MTLPGECICDTQTICCECQTVLNIEVLRSAAGYYIGFFCPHCGPYSRESDYYPTFEAAQKALNSDFYSRS